MLVFVGRDMAQKKSIKKVSYGFREGETTYRGYSTHDVYEACGRYVKFVGHEPTIVIARPDFELVNESPIVIRSYLGAANALLVTHYIKPEEIKKHMTHLPQHKFQKAEESKPEPVSREVYRHNNIPYRKTFEDKSICACPHCGQELTDFDKLGYWYGWALGIYPSYWDDLRLYVFDRDDYICQKCGERKGQKDLRCHHIRPKEEMGVDSARNLMTLCSTCHSDEHPIFPETTQKVLPESNIAIPIVGLQP